MFLTEWDPKRPYAIGELVSEKVRCTGYKRSNGTVATEIVRVTDGADPTGIEF
jgi:hypothetical protein